MDQTALTSFPYHQTPEGRFFPVVPLRLHFKKKIINNSALIDSGASISIFRAEVGKELGLEIEKGKTIYLHGVGGRIKGYLHRLKIEVTSKKFTCPIIFSEEYLVSFNLLGRESFFEKFKIIFDESKKKLTLE